MRIEIFGKSKRHTGRTTTMLKEAERLAREGRAVYVISANEKEQRRLALLLGNPNGNPYDNKFGIKIETPSSLWNFSWEKMCLISAHPNCVVLADHYAVECEIRARLSNLSKAMIEMVRYDLDYKKNDIGSIAEQVIFNTFSGDFFSKELRNE